MSEEEAIKLALVKKYARLKGISEEEAMAMLAPILSDKDKTQELLETLSLIDTIDAQPGTVVYDVKEAVKSKALMKLGERMLEEHDDMEAFMKKLLMWQQKMRIMEKLLGSSEDPRMVALEERMNRLENTITQLVDILRETQTKGVTNELQNAMQQLVDSINQQISFIHKKIEELEHKTELTDIERLRQIAQKLGWELVPPGAKEGELDLEKIKEKLQKLGYKVEPGWISADQLAKILEEERRKIQEQFRKELEKEIEKDRIEATKDTVITGFRILGDVLREILKPVVHKTFKETAKVIEEELSDEELEEALADFEQNRESEPEITVEAKPKKRVIEEDVDLW